MPFHYYSNPRFSYPTRNILQHLKNMQQLQVSMMGLLSACFCLLYIASKAAQVAPKGRGAAAEKPLTLLSLYLRQALYAGFRTLQRKNTCRQCGCSRTRGTCLGLW